MRVPFLIVDNQLIKNSVVTLIDTDGISPLPPKVWEYVEEVRTTVFKVIRDLSKPTGNFLLADELVEGDPTDLALHAKVAQLARDRDALFVPVRLLLSADELRARVQSPERHGRLKSVDPEQAVSDWTNHSVLRPEDCFELDVTGLSASEAAIAN